MSLLRRRCMLHEEVKWDYEWYYDMGTLEENGFTYTVSSGATAKLEKWGLVLFAHRNGNSYIKCTAPTPSAPKSTVEIAFRKEDSAGWFRVLLSNGGYGNQIYIRNDVFEFCKKKIADAVVNKEYKLRLEFDENKGSKVILDDKVIYEGTEFDHEFCANNAIFQQVGGTTVVKSIKYKFN